MEEEDIIKFYFNLGFSQKEILYLPWNVHDIFMSKRTLQRRLSQWDLYRRKSSDILEIALFIVQVTESSSEMLGYRLVHLKCIQNGFNVSQNDVRLLLQLIDPEGVALRLRRRLKRRRYHSRGPNFVWHLDSYDRLKPYGICINGAIDGFSCYIQWLEAHHTSSNPSLIASYYIKTVKSRNGCPEHLRCDFGTENVHTRDMHNFLLETNGEIPANAVILGSSNHNQRIEAWWGFLRKSMAQYWMNLFQGLKDIQGIWTVQFCFMNLIQVI